MKCPNTSDETRWKRRESDRAIVWENHIQYPRVEVLIRWQTHTVNYVVSTDKFHFINLIKYLWLSMAEYQCNANDVSNANTGHCPSTSTSFVPATEANVCNFALDFNSCRNYGESSSCHSFFGSALISLPRRWSGKSTDFFHFLLYGSRPRKRNRS